MEIIRIGEKELPSLAPLAADFRAALNALRGVELRPDDAEAEEELLGYLKAGWPVFAAAENGEYAGYIVCKIEEPTLWVEQIFVSEAYRRRGTASLLFARAEELAASMGEDTVFNFVHPNNDAMLAFLRSKGYTVLNLLEVRKPYRGETPRRTVTVDGTTFDY